MSTRRPNRCFPCKPVAASCTGLHVGLSFAAGRRIVDATNRSGLATPQGGRIDRVRHGLDQGDRDLRRHHRPGRQRPWRGSVANMVFVVIDARIVRQAVGVTDAEHASYCGGLRGRRDIDFLQPFPDQNCRRVGGHRLQVRQGSRPVSQALRQVRILQATEDSLLPGISCDLWVHWFFSILVSSRARAEPGPLRPFLRVTTLASLSTQPDV